MPTRTGLDGYLFDGPPPPAIDITPDEIIPPGRALATRPPVVRPDRVTGPDVDHSDSAVLDRLLSTIDDAVTRLDEPECGPAAREVGRWLRARARDARQQRTGPACCPDYCACRPNGEDW